MTETTLHEQLQELQKAQSETLVRDLSIELLQPKTSTSTSGRTITYLVWRYRGPNSEQGEWITRKAPIFNDEAKLIIDHGPYDPEAIYRVTANRNKRGYWQWSIIEKLNTIQH